MAPYLKRPDPLSQELIYISSPYTHEEAAVQEQRFLQVVRFAGHLMGMGKHVFSPIAHCHPIAQECRLPGDAKYWEGYNRCMMSKCTLMLILCLPGWEESEGIKGELEMAKDYVIPVGQIPIPWQGVTPLLDASTLKYATTAEEGLLWKACLILAQKLRDCTMDPRSIVDIAYEATLEAKKPPIQDTTQEADRGRNRK